MLTMKTDRKKKILVVDSSDEHTQRLCTVLAGGTYRVETESAADRAILTIINGKPDLLIAALDLGAINGYDLCRILRMMPALAGMPILLMNGGDDDLSCRLAAQAGADYYVPACSDLAANILKGVTFLLGGPESDGRQQVWKRDIKTVLTVDDSRPMRKVIKNILTGIGIHNVVEAADGFHGLQKLQEHAVDMVMVDWKMPRMNGCDFIKNVRNNSRHKDLCIIVVTSEGFDDIDQVLKLGADGYLHKPFDARSIQNLVYKFASNLPPAAP